MPPLNSFVSPLEIRFILAMLFKPAFSFSSGIQRLVCRYSGLRLLALSQFQAFLAASAYAESAASYLFASIAPPSWRSAFSQFAPIVKLGFPVLAFGSNSALKRTGLPPAAYLSR